MQVLNSPAQTGFCCVPAKDRISAAVAAIMKVAFNSNAQSFLVDMSGANPPEIVAKGDLIWVPNWSPDGNLLVVASAKEGAAFGDRNSLGLRIVDLRTGKTSIVPSPGGMVGGWFWFSAVR